jgi:hypothetical protein
MRDDGRRLAAVLEIRAGDVRVGDRLVHRGWTVERVGVSLSGLVVATGANGSGDRFALNHKPTFPLVVERS